MKKVMIVTKKFTGAYSNTTSLPEFKEVEDNWIPEHIENTIFEHVHITDYNYFSMIDNQIRSEYTLCEEFVLLPKIEKLYEINNISTDKSDLIEYPTEGYYYKTEGLRKYFQLVRNLQENPNVYKKVILPAAEVDELIWLFGNTIWGTIKSERSETIFPRMKDILTNTLNALQLPHLWTIDIIMGKIKEFATGNPNLVELAYLTGDIRCLCAGAETNALYREMSFCVSGCMALNNIPPDRVTVHWWDVTEPVQNLGERLVDSYNEIMNKFIKNFSDPKDFTVSHTNSNIEIFTIYGFGKGRKDAKLIQKPSFENYKNFKFDLETPRVAMLGQLIGTPAHYHWILDNNEVTEIWMDGVMTTERYKEGRGAMQFRGWDMSGVIDEDGKVRLGKLWSTKSKQTGLPEIVPGEVKTNGLTLNWSDPTDNMQRHD